MATNDFKPFAAGAGANVMTQVDWVALAALVTGFQSGKASSAQVNKALRQGTVMASVLGQFVANNSGANVLDNGDTATVLANLTAALKSLLLTRAHPFADIKADGTTAVAEALANLGLSDIKLAGVCTGVLSTTGNISIPLIIGGVLRRCLIQWGLVDAPRQATTNVTLPVTYDNACLFTLAVKGSAISLTGEYGVGCSPVNNSTIAVSNSSLGTGPNQGIRWLTIGY